AVDRPGGVYVADTGNGTIRTITPAGAVTSFVAGIQGESVAVDSAGSLYVGAYDGTIRKITPAGVMTTLAGSAGHGGTNDGIGGAARFGVPCCASPLGVAVDSAGNVYVADSRNNTIRKVTPAGAVTTLAGLTQFDTTGWPIGGSTDGTGSTARFNDPYGVAVDAADNIYVTDTGNYTIRKVTPD